MAAPARTASEDTLLGIGLATAGYGLFSTQDATVKWLVETYSVPQVLFTRSLVIMALAMLFGGRSGFAALAASPNKAAMGLRAVLILLAWLFYYTASRQLGLAQLTTIYFAAPIITVGLSVAILRERVGAARWAVVLVGFGGVLMAADPAGSLSWTPALLALGAAACWGTTSILVRLIARSETSLNQMLVSNGLFALACAPVLPWLWIAPDPFGLALMLALGVAGGLGQYLLFESFRHAPASVIAPVEYTGLVWAFALGFLIWRDIPGPHVFAGAAIISASCLALVWLERRRAAA